MKKPRRFSTMSMSLGYFIIFNKVQWSKNSFPDNFFMPIVIPSKNKNETIPSSSSFLFVQRFSRSILLRSFSSFDFDRSTSTNFSGNVVQAIDKNWKSKRKLGHSSRLNGFSVISVRSSIVDGTFISSSNAENVGQCSWNSLRSSSTFNSVDTRSDWSRSIDRSFIDFLFNLARFNNTFPVDLSSLSFNVRLSTHFLLFEQWTRSFSLASSTITLVFNRWWTCHRNSSDQWTFSFSLRHRQFLLVILSTLFLTFFRFLVRLLCFFLFKLWIILVLVFVIVFFCSSNQSEKEKRSIQ